MKLKLVLPIMAAFLSTAAFAANDTSIARDGSASPTVIASISNSPAGFNRNSVGRSDERANIAVQERDNIHFPAAETQPANSNDTCMGSKSTGMQLPIVGGISLGSSWTDKNCMMIKNARELWNMGYKKAALARMCMDDGNREALESTGTPCPSRRAEAPVPKIESASLTYLQ